MNVRSILLIGLFLACIGGPTIQAQDQRQAEEDLYVLRQTAQQFQAAFNQGNAEQVAALWTKDGEYVDAAEHATRGREAIQNLYAEFFKNNPGVKIRVKIDSLRLLSDSAAIEDGVATLDPAPPGAPATGQYSVVHVKEDGKWKMATVRDRHIEAPTTYHHLAELEWLIGDWQAEEHGVKLEMKCRWLGNKSFIKRTSTVTKPDGSTSSTVQIIGYHPETQHIQSWTFGDSGHSVEQWAAENGGWAIASESWLHDGGRGSAVNYLMPLDHNAFTWQSAARIANGIRLPNSNEILIKRVQPSKK
jgi:uncharacterized protein (TIGR02246 family)